MTVMSYFKHYPCRHGYDEGQCSTCDIIAYRAECGSAGACVKEVSDD